MRMIYTEYFICIVSFFKNFIPSPRYLGISIVLSSGKAEIMQGVHLLLFNSVCCHFSSVYHKKYPVFVSLNTVSSELYKYKQKL